MRILLKVSLGILFFLYSFTIFTIQNPAYSQQLSQEYESSNFTYQLNEITKDLTIIKDQHQNEQANENLSISIALFTGVIIPIGLLIYQQIRSRRILVNQNAESLLKEIESNQGALTGTQGYDIVEYSGLDDKQSKIRYTNTFLDYDSYENLINSGQFSYFTPDTQFSLRELYTRIKDHYRTMTYIDELEDKFKLQYPDDNSKFLKAVARHEVVLTLWESEILNLFPTTLEKLKNAERWII